MAIKYGRHSTVDKRSLLEIHWFETIPYIKRIVLGPVSPFMHKRGYVMKVLGERRGGVQLKAFIEGGSREFFLCVDKEHVESVLKLMHVRYS